MMVWGTGMLEATCPNHFKQPQQTSKVPGRSSLRAHTNVTWLGGWPAYLGSNRREAAAEMHMLVDLTAIGGQKPGPKGLVFAI